MNSLIFTVWEVFTHLENCWLPTVWPCSSDQMPSLVFYLRRSPLTTLPIKGMSKAVRRCQTWGFSAAHCSVRYWCGHFFLGPYLHQAAHVKNPIRAIPILWNFPLVVWSYNFHLQSVPSLLQKVLRIFKNNLIGYQEGFFSRRRLSTFLRKPSCFETWIFLSSVSFSSDFLVATFGSCSQKHFTHFLVLEKTYGLDVRLC